MELGVEFNPGLGPSWLTAWLARKAQHDTASVKGPQLDNIVRNAAISICSKGGQIAKQGPTACVFFAAACQC